MACSLCGVSVGVFFSCSLPQTRTPAFPGHSLRRLRSPRPSPTLACFAEVGQRTFSLRRFPTLDTIGALHLPEKPTDASESLASTREAGQDPRPQLASRRPLLHSLSCEVSPAAHQHTKQFASLPGTPA